jgi:REP element-mobilizing transposase RayT
MWLGGYRKFQKLIVSDITASQDSRSKTCPERSRRESEKEIWQRRFWKHVTRDDTDDRRHIDDTHYNPVRYAYELANVLNLL